mgnify:CR=1 FL=1
MLKMSGPRMWLYVRCKSSPAQTIYGCSSMESAGLQNRRLGEQSLPPVPDVWFHSSTKRKRAFLVRCAKAAGRRIFNWLTPAQ